MPDYTDQKGVAEPQNTDIKASEWASHPCHSAEEVIKELKPKRSTDSEGGVFFDVEVLTVMRDHIYVLQFEEGRGEKESDGDITQGLEKSEGGLDVPPSNSSSLMSFGAEPMKKKQPGRFWSMNAKSSPP